MIKYNFYMMDLTASPGVISQWPSVIGVETFPSCQCQMTNDEIEFPIRWTYPSVQAGTWVIGDRSSVIGWLSTDYR